MPTKDAMAPARVRFWGDRACFTRPETRTERLSYPVPTPSAVRGMLEAILYRPQFCWEIREIWVLKPINWFSELRNEIATAPFKYDVAEPYKSTVESYRKPVIVEDCRLQRHTTGLADVDYVVVADPVPLPEFGAPRHKYMEMFERRVRLGQCYHRPAFGQRNWPAYFAPVPAGTTPLPLDMHVGRILFDKVYRAERPAVPVFFEAKVEQGVLRVPEALYDKTRRHYAN